MDGGLRLLGGGARVSIECPIDECDYSAQSIDSVIAHMQGKRDPPHKGIGYEKARIMIEQSGQGGEEAPDDPAPAHEAPASSGTDESQPEGELEFPDSGSGQGGNQGSETSNGGGSEPLPCGHESFDPSEAPAPPFTVTCEECGGAWTVTEL